MRGVVAGTFARFGFAVDTFGAAFAFFGAALAFVFAFFGAAFVFAFAHIITVSGASAGEALQQAVVAFTARLPVAVALGWIFVRRRSVWASFGLHATFNAILLVVAEVARQAS